MSDLSLEIVEGPGAGTIFPLAGTLEIGRGAGAAIRLPDEHCDRMHARVTIDDDGVLLTDLGRRGGTFVNHAELLTATRIRPGDEVQVGVTVLRLRTAGATSATRPTPPPLAAAARDPAYMPGTLAVRKPPRARGRAAPEVDELLDIRTKTKARHAPLAVLVIVVWTVLLYLLTQRF